MIDFQDILEEWAKPQIDKYGMGIVTAELQNLAGLLLSQCDDEAFKLEAIETYKNIVMEKE